MIILMMMMIMMMMMHGGRCSEDEMNCWNVFWVRVRAGFRTVTKGDRWHNGRHT
jgi:hypothetical protein